MGQHNYLPKYVMFWGVQHSADLLHGNLLIVVQKVQRRVQMFAKVSENLTGPILLKSFNCNNHIVLVAIETFQHYRIGEIFGNLCKHLDFGASALHFSFTIR